ncbi:E3 ubiquitin-protein ligase RNF126 isoform X2 [Nannospalax galili]|uniref:E3 ubiquitin-protein ligase RNF126 isoform X2 n=1 Tax=Nannospalax galili TaxID=1026970 RepID=UPI0004ED4A1A|nr:E3 ubiquitin-protein ligase RNF126 isoform X2 [Nannospalax galili]
MAEASPHPGRYFCHCCSVEIVPRLPDYICPRCESGFIEELPEETRNTENGSATSTASTDQSRQPFESVDQHLFTLPQGYSQFAFGIFDDSFEIPTFSSGVQADDGRDPESRREREHQSRHRIIQQLVNGIISPAAVPSLGLGPWGVLHSNPMDYAWGANGLDAIITQLLNQFENTGPPPADKEKIQALPTVPVTEEHALGLSALCAKMTTHWVRVCASCHATTCSTTAASCPGWSSMTAALSAARASQDRTQPPTLRALLVWASPPPRPRHPPTHPVMRMPQATPEFTPPCMGRATCPPQLPSTAHSGLRCCAW